MEHNDTQMQAAPGAPAPLPGLIAKEHITYLWEAQKYIDHYIGAADSRATMTLVLSSTVIGALYQGRVHAAFTGSDSVRWLEWDTLASVAAFICLVLGVFFCVLAIIPRLKKAPAAGFIYWESVLQHGSAATHWERYRGKTSDELGEHLAGHVFVNASIATRKYKLLHRGMLAALAGGMLGAIVLVFR